MNKDGGEKRRAWRKLHLTVDVETHEIICAQVTRVNIGDVNALLTLLAF